MSQGGRPRKRPRSSQRSDGRISLSFTCQTRPDHEAGRPSSRTTARAAVILHAISCGCYRETAADLAGIKAETLSHWMGGLGNLMKRFSGWCGRPKPALNQEWSTSSRDRPKFDRNWRSPSSRESSRSDGRRSQWSRHRLNISTSTWPTSFTRFKNGSLNSTLKANSRLQQSSTPP